MDSLPLALPSQDGLERTDRTRFLALSLVFNLVALGLRVAQPYYSRQSVGGDIHCDIRWGP